MGSIGFGELLLLLMIGIPSGAVPVGLFLAGYFVDMRAVLSKGKAEGATPGPRV